MSGPYRSWGGGVTSEGLHWEAGGVGLPLGWRTGNGGQPRYVGCSNVGVAYTLLCLSPSCSPLSLSLRFSFSISPLCYHLLSLPSIFGFCLSPQSLSSRLSSCVSLLCFSSASFPLSLHSFSLVFLFLGLSPSVSPPSFLVFSLSLSVFGLQSLPSLSSPNPLFHSVSFPLFLLPCLSSLSSASPSFSPLYCSPMPVTPLSNPESLSRLSQPLPYVSSLSLLFCLSPSTQYSDYCKFFLKNVLQSSSSHYTYVYYLRLSCCSREYLCKDGRSGQKL
jgi:hypothetical protein